MYSFIIVLRALATVLVVNSHMDNIYPISAIATGGSLGDTFFFFVSGFCLYKINDSYGKWLVKRIIRLYPALIIVTLIMCVLKGSLTFKQIIPQFIFPTNYQFITAIVVFYIVYYPIAYLCKKHNYVIYITLILTIFVYLISYIFFLDLSQWTIESAPFKYIYWFIAFLIGGCAREKYDVIKKPDKISKAVLYFTCTISFFGSFAIKLVILHFDLWQLQIIIHFFQIIFLISFIRIMIENENRIKEFEKRNNFIWKAVSTIGSLTLENYLIMDIIINKCQNIVFPLSFLLTVILIFVFAYLLHWICKKISSFALAKIKK